MPSHKSPKIKSTKDAFSEIASQMRASLRFPNINAYVPHEKQVDFHSSGAHGRLFIGGNRSGKTVGGATEAVWTAQGNHPYKRLKWEPPVKLRVVTVDFIQGLNQIVLPEIKKWIPPSALKNGSWEDSYSKADRELTLENNSTIEFMSYEQELEKFAGTSRHGIWFDEEPPYDIWVECKLRLVDTFGDWWITMTPVEGMTWTYDEIYSKFGVDPNIFVVEVDMDDNPHLSEESKDVVLSGLTEDEVAARKHGQYVRRGGLIYKEFDPNMHVIDPMSPPKGWLRFNMMDHGTTNPTAWLWGAVDNQGRILIYDEWYKGDLIVAQHALKVHEKNIIHGYPSYNVGDPSIVNKDPITGTSIQIEYMENGIPIIPANNSVLPGIDRVKKKLLGLGPNRQDKQLFVTRNCTNLIWEMRRYAWAVWEHKRTERDRNKKEEPRKKDDHACDALRYGVASRPERDDGSLIPELPQAPAGASVAIDPSKDFIDKDVLVPSRRDNYDTHLGEEF
jgi:phage terminase large subunit-like protein